MSKPNKITILSIINVFLFCYILWDKSNSGGCPACHYVPFLPISDVQLALAGILGSVVLSIVCYFSTKILIFKYLALGVSFLFTFFGFFLLGGQLIFHRKLCYYCITTIVIFYITFSLLLYDIVIKKMLFTIREFAKITKTEV